ncbi:dehydrogenase [Labrys miyagiensis]|uniref:Dehydrogenase n=1 Tax=Labrys miyagiensis TaxID=346912 RepID=A0ABQ6CPE3_9HYPH|nr:PQQ-dependent sugar dehydrogenase [Labrys miyagiensis]GLS20091.1 dehydrogenase [Labrys miyagiensis]
MREVRQIGQALILALLFLLPVQAALAEVNAGNRAYSTSRPFKITPVATFDTPWAIAVMPEGRLLVTEKGGRLYLVTLDGRKQEVPGVPPVQAIGQDGLLDIVLSPRFGTDHQVYFTYVEPGEGGGRLALARARFAESGDIARLADLAVIWRATPEGGGGQPGGIIAFAPDGQHLFLASGDRMRPQTAQDPGGSLGKILRLNLDGSTPADNPMAAQGGVQAQIWTMGHRNPYGLAFAADGKLWEDEMGPRGGDELNLIRPGRNYGWPLVSNGDNYDGTPIPRHRTRPDLEAPIVYWTPVIAPAGLAFYSGAMFPTWHGSAFIGALRQHALVRIAFDGKGGAREADRWDMGQRIRDVVVAADGALLLIEDRPDGRLLRLTPAK